MTCFKRASFAVFAAFFALRPSIQAASVTDLTYDASGSTVTITGCNSTASGLLTIPATIEGKPVVKIGESAFFGCHELTEVVIGNSVTLIDGFAFFGCRGLQTVTVGDNVSTIGTRAFNSCSALIHITLGKKVALIEASAFERSSRIEKVIIPDSVTRIGRSAFRYCTGLRHVDFRGDAPTIGDNAFDSIHKLALMTAGPGAQGFETAALDLPVFTKVGSLTYDASGSTASVVNCDNKATGPQEILLTLNGRTVTKIARSAFERCTGITSVTIPETITSIDSSAFAGCTGLSSIQIPESVTSLGEGAFEGCVSLESAQLGDGLLTINDSAFRGSGLTSLTVPNKVSRIGNSAFADCSELKIAVLGDRVSTIGSFSFSFCSSLTEITLGRRLSRIGFRAFEGCHQLTSVIFKGSAPGNIRNDEFSQLDSDVTVYVQPDSNRFRATFGGAPVVILGEQAPVTEPVVPPVVPSTPTGGTPAISSLRIDPAGNVVITLTGSNAGVQIGYSPNLQSAFQPVSNATPQGGSELVIPSTATEIQGTQGFFRIASE
ncbi:leucine-rich repeat domain-containing protein [bacterium]|jgi:hypothetical protein|nr:leucine-rich repeat domain-containing protein [bacterium]